METVKLPIGSIEGYFETRLLRSVQKAGKIDTNVVLGKRQERDFETLKQYNPDQVIGKNGPAYGFELYLDNQLAYISPPVWVNEADVKPAVLAWVKYVKQLPPFDS